MALGDAGNGAYVTSSAYGNLFAWGYALVAKGGTPSGSSVTSACYHAAAMVNDSVGEKIVEWDSENDVFIRDPYFLFYLRWADVADC